ncbi:hypothetical protein EST38_g5923 [Candolleomyces aberdarensis]|uniref:Uncharacterized protein n=1 Tax=Candolleomyces aberdarensis TaxID=2316362 RepID=A0A4Q2DM10_9AGAR|nr:hypothetical protein EST38_g5923 [Candolleomyces aberdarensis]
MPRLPVTTSSIATLPDDVLSNIFATLLRASYIQDVPPAISRSHPSVIVSHVCQDWRTLALATRLLWTEVRVKQPPYPFKREVYGRRTASGPPSARLQRYRLLVAEWRRRVFILTEATKTWIARSENCPLSVHLNLEPLRYTNDSLGPPLSESLVEIVNLLCNESFRWKFATFSFPFSLATLALKRPLFLMPEEVPRLERVGLTVYFDPPWNGQTVLADLLGVPEGISLLQGAFMRSLRLDSNLCGDISRFPVDWSGLTELSVGALTRTHPLQALYLLQLAPNLVHCHLHLGINPIPTLYGNLYPHGAEISLRNLVNNVTLSYLRSLVLDITDPIPTDLAQCLTLPSLRSLQLIGPRSFQLEWFCNFGAQLTDVSFNYSSLIHGDLVYALVLLRNVTRLKLSGEGSSDWCGEDGWHSPAAVSSEILQSLSPRFGIDVETGKEVLVDEPTACPKLDSFYCRLDGNVNECTEEELVEFIEAKRKVPPGHDCVAQIKNVHVVFPEDVGVEFPDTVISIGALEELRGREVDMEDLILCLEYPCSSDPTSYTTVGNPGGLDIYF